MRKQPHATCANKLLKQQQYSVKASLQGYLMANGNQVKICT